jgi:ceramide glucosyltransferase
MLTFTLALFGVALCVRILSSHRRMWRLLAPAALGPSSAVAYPSLTVIRPIKGLDVGARENTEALLAQDYPGEVQFLFVFDTSTDPAYALVSERVAASHKNARVLLAGARPARRTGKLHAMIVGMAQAQGELVAFSDSDSRPLPSLLRQLVAELQARPDAGASFAPAVTQGDPRSFAEMVYGLMINSWYGAAAAEQAGERRELPFIMGQVMVLRRDALGAIGGLESAEGQLVDDMYLGARIADAGYKNVMVQAPLHLVTGPLSLRALLSLLRKWMAFSRSGLPASFVRRNFVRGAELGLALVGTLATLALDMPALALPFGAALGLWIYSQIMLYGRLSGAKAPLRFAWVPLVVPFLSGLLLASTRLSRVVEWRGQAYQLDARARLSPALSPTAPARSSAAPAAPPHSLTARPPAGAVVARAHHRQTHAAR